MSDGRSPRILLVDDDPTMRMLASSALEDGFVVAEAGDAAGALASFEAHRPDAVLLDVMMPDVDGFELCARIRALAGGANVPILMMTGLDDERSIDRAYQAGATDFITKPMNYPLLGHRLRYILRAASAFEQAQGNADRLSRAQRLARLAQFEVEPTSGCFRWSTEVTEVFGVEEGDGTVDALLRFVHADDRSRVARALEELAPHRLEYRFQLPNGAERVVHQEADVVLDPLTGERRLIGAAQDITELRAAERQVRELAYFDGLTGLPNRTLLRRFLASAVTRAAADGENVAVLAIDLDGFKRVNDTLGHAAGDGLLREVGERLRGCIRGGRTSWGELANADNVSFEQEMVGEAIAARIGGDEFVVVLTHLRRAEDAAAVARRIGERLAVSFGVAGTEVFVSSSIGVALSPENGNDVDALLERADAALYHAKDMGRNNFQFFTAGVFDKARRRMEIENALRGALARSGIGPKTTALGPCEFHLQYQPKVEVPSGRIVGAEALLRWSSPVLGNVSPAEFVVIAEDTGLIVALGEWVLRTACGHAVDWRGRGLGQLRVAVNVSARQFRDAEFVAKVRTILVETGLDPSLLELEITEGLVMQDTSASSRILADLKRLGVRIALDDFGTGYSSLSYLTRLPIDALKIDRSFISGIGTAGKSETITSAIIALSRGLSIDVVVEGVETEEQLAFVNQHGTAEIQGYLFAKPMPLGELAAWCTSPIVQARLSKPPRHTEESGLFSLPSLTSRFGT